MRVATIALAFVGIAACGQQNQPSENMDPKISASIEAFKNRKIYKQLSPSILATIPNDKLEQAVVDYVFEKIGNDFDNSLSIVAKMKPGLRALYVTWWVEAEVNNGGFNQYYWNSSGQFASQAPEAFEYFGAIKYASLMREANKLHSDEVVEISKYKRKGTIEAFSESYDVSKLGPLDDRFYKISENLSALRISAIRSKPEDFSGK